MPMIKEGTYEKPKRPRNSVPPGQRGSDTKQVNLKLLCCDGCGTAVIISVPVEGASLCDRIELPVNGMPRVCRAGGSCWLEWICEDCVSKMRMTDFVRGGI